MKQRPLNDILNECYERMADGQTLEYCLQVFHEHADELKPLLETKTDLDTLAQITPDPEFKTRAYYEMRNALETTWAEKAPTRAGFNWRPRLAMIAASVIGLVVVAGGGTFIGASGAMPDSALYQVKLFGEQARVNLTGDEAAKAELYTELAAKRVDELDYLVRNQADMDDVNNVLSELDGLLASASVVPLGDDAAPKSSRTFGSSEMAAPVAPTSAPTTATTTPTAIVSDAPTEVPTVAVPSAAGGVDAATVTQNADGTVESQTIAVAPGEPPAPEMAPMLLTEDAAGGGANLTEAQLAVINQLDMSRVDLIARLYAIIEAAPDSIKPLIQKAIADLEAGYNSAINNWALPQNTN